MGVWGSEAVILALYGAPLVVAAGWDLATFRIPNALNLMFLALFPLAAQLAPQPVDWLWHLAAGGVVLAAGFGLFALRLFGGGDVKLLAVAALWLGWDRLPAFVLGVAVLGGGLAVVVLLLRSPVLATALAHLGRTPAVLHKGAAIPYGIAIAGGGLAMAKALPLLGG